MTIEVMRTLQTELRIHRTGGEFRRRIKIITPAHLPKNPGGRQKYTPKELQQFLINGHSIKEIWIQKALVGNDELIRQIIHKLFSDQVKGDFTGELKVTWQSKK